MLQQLLLGGIFGERRRSSQMHQDEAGGGQPLPVLRRGIFNTVAFARIFNNGMFGGQAVLRLEKFGRPWPARI